MNRETLCALLLGVALVASGCQQNKGAASAGPSPSPSPGMTDDEKAVYALGAAMGQQIEAQVKPLNLNAAELELLKKGFSASLAGQKPELPLEQYLPKLQARAEANAKVMAAAEKQKSADFIAKAAQEPGAVKTLSGLIYTSLAPGKGPSPKATDAVQVHYRGTLTDGTEFDSSAKHGGPAQFQVTGVIPCWTEAVLRMKVGERARLVCPSDIAYGDRGQPPVIPPGATLVFEIELLGIGQKTAGGPGR
jgi:FKBP-type peptidyl-prolyl cis-trans isomerase FkpA